MQRRWEMNIITGIFKAILLIILFLQLKIYIYKNHKTDSRRSRKI